jgi:hypothetical protein
MVVLAIHHDAGVKPVYGHKVPAQIAGSDTGIILISLGKH